MKTKIIILLLISLFSVQGWASPVDSTNTQSTKNGLDKTEYLDSLVHQWDSIGKTFDPLQFQDFFTGDLGGGEFSLEGLGASLLLKLIEWCIDRAQETIILTNIYGYGNLNAHVGEFTEYTFNALGWIQEPVSVELDDPNGVFSINVGTIQPGRFSIPIKILCHPGEVGSYSAKITFKNNNKIDKTLFFRCYAEERSITVTPTTWFEIAGQSVGKPVSKTYFVKGDNLRDHIKIDLNDPTGMFSINKTDISADEYKTGSELVVTYLPTEEGTHEASIAIHDAIGEHFCLKSIYMRCSATERAIIVDKDQLSFPNLTVGKTDSIPINVNAQNLSGSLGVILCDPSGMFSIDKKVITATEAAYGATVNVTYSPTNTGTHEATIVINGGDAPSPQYIHLRGYAINRTISVDKTALNYGNVKIGETKPLTFTATGTNLTGQMNVEIEDKNQFEMFMIQQTSITNYENETHVTVTVLYKPTATGIHQADVKISGGDAIENKLVRLSGTCVANPTITVNTTSLDFETIEVGQEKPMSINVTGTYLTGPITVTKEETHGGQFSISRETLNASGGSVIVTFKPTEAGTFGGRIKISGGDASPVSVTLNGSARELRVTKSSLDFGTIKKNETSPKKFTVYGDNLLGNVTLISSNKNLFEVIPETITPAEAKAGKEVTVTYKPTAGGTHSGKIIVSAEGITNKEVAVSGKCAEIKVNKTSLDFKTIEVGNDTTITINVTGSNVTGSITVKKQETHGGQFTISRETLPSTGGNVVVTFKPTEAGSFGGSISISGEGADPISVSLTGKALELSVYPSSLNLGTTYKNGTLTKKFTVYGGNLTDDVTLSSNKTVFDVSPKKITPAEAKAGKEVTVTFKPTTGGSYSGEITVSASGVAPKKISVSGKCAVISSNPTSYDFGNVAVGKPVTKVITITGTNLTGAMSITLAETEGGQYSINKTTLPASGGTVIVTFKPTDAKTFGASLKISGGNAAAVSVSLTGKGVTPTITKNKSTLTFTGSSITSDYVKITGTNLDDIISLTVTGSTNFTVSPSTISISDAVDGKQVKVTCNPKNASSAEAKLKISSPYASTKYVTLKYSRGSSGGGETQICSVEPDDEQEDEVKTGEFEVTNLAFGASTSDVDELSMSSKIYADGQNIVIESPEEQNALISDLAGRARNVSLQVGRNEIPVNASGIYIVRIREKTTKLIIK